MTPDEVIAAWDQPGATASIHPTRGISEGAYWASGEAQAALLAQDIPAGSRVMDFGCGDGRVAIPLRALGYDVTGVDASPNMLAALNRHAPDLATFRSDGSDFGKHLGRRKFDAVYCLAVLIHHSHETGQQLVERLRAVVRKGGILVLDWPVADEPAETNAWIGVTTWSRDQQDQITKRLGLTRLDVDRPWAVYQA
ncbi:class I SAM-dependent methyltransferase [Streptomyces lasiicapitis]|uniref:class I SAM-dependent methyltransferase n=1 Tax=Streptomyces lasiicapitis TaxID=1923961 RepID=UPI0036C6D0DC